MKGGPAAQDLAMRILNNPQPGRELLEKAERAFKTKDVAQLADALEQLCQLYGVRLFVRRDAPGASASGG